MVLRPQGILGYREFTIGGMVRLCRRLGSRPAAKPEVAG